MHKRTAMDLWNDLQEFPYFRGISTCLGSTILGAHDPEAITKAAAFLKGWSDALNSIVDEGEEETGGEDQEESEGGARQTDPS